MDDAKILKNMFLVNDPAGSRKTTYIHNMIINLLAEYPKCILMKIKSSKKIKEKRKNLNNFY